VIAIQLDDGRRTTAIRYEPQGLAPRAGHGGRRPGTVVLAHGAGAGQRHPFIVNLARRLAAAGIDVTTFDFPYMEEKRRAPDRADVLERCFRRVLEHVDGIGMSPIVIGGKSMGGRIATHLSAQGADIAGVFALGYPLHPPGRPDQPRTAHLPAITVPVLIVQGERDPFGTPSELTPVIATIPGRVELEVVAGGDHSLAVRGRPAGQLYDWLGDRIAGWVRSI
jgi:hypothetical protein